MHSTLRLYRNPLRQALTASTWRAARYLLGYQVIGWALSAAVLTAAAGAAVLAITLAGIPLLVAAAGVIRGCANAERSRLRAVLGEPVEGRYRGVTRPGIMASASTRWKDPATWRDFAYLAGMFVPLVILGFVVLAVWLTLAAGVTLPLWYWAPYQHFPYGLVVRGVQLGYFPNGPSGHGAAGLYVDTLPKALVTAAACLILFILFNYVVVATARMHAAVARALLRPPQDPLAPAKDLLLVPGPLPPLLSRTSSGISPAHEGPAHGRGQEPANRTSKRSVRQQAERGHDAPVAYPSIARNRSRQPRTSPAAFKTARRRADRRVECPAQEDCGVRLARAGRRAVRGQPGTRYQEPAQL